MRLAFGEQRDRAVIAGQKRLQQHADWVISHGSTAVVRARAHYDVASLAGTLGQLRQ